MLAILTALGAALAGCATAPSGGPPQRAPGGSNQAQAYVQPLPAPGPTARWKATDVVLGFLHASASYAFDPAAARQYLVPSLRKRWHPERGPVAVLGAPTGLVQLPYNPQILGPAGSELIVRFTGQHLATLSQTFQYQYAPGQNVQYEFVLAKTNGVWLIEQLPQQQQLMLTESDFEDVYQPRNLFFFAPWQTAQAPGVLVPDPVYAPLQSANSALNTDLATGLVNALLNGQAGWVSGATASAFPAGTRLLRKVTITGKTAEVDLGGAAAKASLLAREDMAAQLLATLSDGEYSKPPLASHLQLFINNVPQDVPVPGNMVPGVTGGPLFLVTGPGSVGQLPGAPKAGTKPTSALGPDQLGSAVITAVAVSPAQERQQTAIAVQQQHGGCAVELRLTDQAAYKSYPLSDTGSGCSSLSWDSNGNLWAAAGQNVWLFEPNRAPVAVDLSAMSLALEPSDQILAVRMAPDAVRAAVLVTTPAGNRLLLAAVRVKGSGASFGQAVTIGSGLTSPQAMGWYDAYHLAVLATGGIYDVPLTGGAAQQPGFAPELIITAPPGAATLTTDGTELAVGTSQGEVFTAAVSSPSWSFVTNGAYPSYPG
jgi:Lipoprotein LpqB beta-propeller domain/Sporulation and spore germination